MYEALNWGSPETDAYLGGLMLRFVELGYADSYVDDLRFQMERGVECNKPWFAAAIRAEAWLLAYTQQRPAYPRQILLQKVQAENGLMVPCSNAVVAEEQSGRWQLTRHFQDCDLDTISDISDDIRDHGLNPVYVR